MPATTTLSRKILVFPSPTPAGLKLEGHVSDVHFTVSHRQPKLIAIDKQPDDAAAQPLSQKTSRYCWSSSFHVTWPQSFRPWHRPQFRSLSPSNTWNEPNVIQLSVRARGKRG
jgi:hypothetical protein